MSKRQLQILQDFRFGEIILALDNDVAGHDGTMQAINKLQEAGWLLPQIKIIRFPNNIKDPQDCSPELLRELYVTRKEVIYGLIT